MASAARPSGVLKAIYENDTSTLSRLGRAGGYASARKRREERDREDALRAVDEEMHERSFYENARSSNEDTYPPEMY